MLSHPFTESLFNKAIGITLIAVAIVVEWGLLIVYSDAAMVPALIDSLLSVGLLAIAGFMGWYLLGFIRVWTAQLSIAVLVQFICIGVSFTILAILGMENTETFLKSLPLRFLFGLLCWIILLQWYRMLQYADSVQEPEEKQEVENTQEPVHEVIDRISVKDGSRIHIIHMNELICLQASGDYVTLFTPSGQYIKEQTMKYFETHLPSTFVRIHRSSIVNTEFIMRVELFGKENYQVKLKNGTSLRASNTGYKLLKERLAL